MKFKNTQWLLLLMLISVDSYAALSARKVYCPGFGATSLACTISGTSSLITCKSYAYASYSSCPAGDIPSGLDGTATSSAPTILTHIYFPSDILAYPDYVCANDNASKTYCWTVTKTSGSGLVMTPEDSDNDGTPDWSDADDDNDGVPDVDDAFPLDASEWADADGDGIGDNTDNCPLVANAGQLDNNGNGTGDVCEFNGNPLKSARAGSAVAFADFNNDGFDDVVVGIPLFDVINGAVILKDAGRIDIYSGATGDVLSSFNGTTAGQQFGSALAVVADQNTDGISDLVVGEPLFDTATLKDAGRVVLYSGSDGALLQQIAAGGAAGDHFGAAVAVGNGNLIVGSPWADLPLLKDAGYVTVFNGISNTILYIRAGVQTKQFFGAALAFDEVNDDILVGSPGFDVLLPVKLTDAGRTDIFDSADGISTALFSVEGSTKGNRFGASVASFGADMGGSTDIDWAVGSPGADVVDPVTLKLHKDIGNVQVFSGFNAVAQVQIDGETAGDNFGAAISAGGDINNDNIPDIAIGAPGYDAPGTKPIKDAGTVEVFSGSEVY